MSYFQADLLTLVSFDPERPNLLWATISQLSISLSHRIM